MIKCLLDDFKKSHGSTKANHRLEHLMERYTMILETELICSNLHKSRKNSFKKDFFLPLQLILGFDFEPLMLAVHIPKKSSLL